MSKGCKKLFFGVACFFIAILYNNDAKALELTENMTLEENITDGIHVPSGASVMLDLNGYKVTGSVTTTESSASNKATIVNEGTLVITDTSSTKSGLVEGGADGSYAVLNRNGNLTINGGSYSIVISAYTCASSNKKGQCTTYNGPSLISNGWYNGEQNTSGVYSNLIINDGVFNGGINNVKNDEYGKLTINGGTFNAIKYIDINPINSDILMGDNVLTGGKTFKLTNGTFDGDIAVQMVGADQERTFEVTGGTFDEDPSSGSRIEMSGSQYDTNIYTSFIVENIKLQKLDTANLNIRDLTIKNVETTNSNSLNAIAIKASGKALIENVISGKKLAINGAGENNQLTINNLTAGEFTTSGNVQMNNSELTTIKFGANSSVTSTGVFNDVTADLFTASRTATNVTINGGEYGRVSNTTSTSYKTASNGATIIINKDAAGNLSKIDKITATGAGNITINNAKVTDEIETNYGSTIIIKDGIFEGSLIVNDIVKSDSSVVPGGTIEVTGGVFVNSIADTADGYVKEGYSRYKYDDDNYIVLIKKGLPVGYKKLLKVGESYEIGNLNSLYYICSIDGDSIEIKDGIATAKKVGKTKITLTSTELVDSPLVNELEFVVYNVVESDQEQEKEANDVTYQSLNEIVDKIINAEEVTEIDTETVQKIKTAIEEGKTIETEVVIEEISPDKVDEKSKERIAEEVKKLGEDAVVTKYIDISVIIKADELELGKINKLTKPIEISVKLPENLKEVEEDKTRYYFVIRIHDGETTILKAKYENGYLIFETDRFSDYAYGYFDIKTVTVTDEDPAQIIDSNKEDTTDNTEKAKEDIKSNPHTGDNVNMIVITLCISLVGFGYFTYYKKRKFIKNN